MTHDRYFLDDLVDRIVEITPGAGVTSYPGNYEAYLEQKLVGEEQPARRRSTSATGGSRRRWRGSGAGVEARRTKSKARIERARRLMAEKGFAAAQGRRLQAGRAAAALADRDRGGSGLAKRFGERRRPRGRRLPAPGAASASGSSGRTASARRPSCGCCSASSQPDAGDGRHRQADAGRLLRPAAHDARPGADRVRGRGGQPAGTTSARTSSSSSGRRVALRDYLDDLLFPPACRRCR